MADYVVRVEASTEEAEKKLKRVDQKVVKLEKGATIDIKLPTAEQTLSTLGKIASATASIGKQALAISRAANVGPGAVINDLDDLFGIVSSGAKKSISAMDMLRKATPQDILGSSFEVASNQATALAQRISNIGYEIFGVTQSVNILRQAFGGMFDETVGREIRLQESLLRTRTTLASTADVAVNGKRLTDPFQALMALEGPVEEALQNIRRRSLDIAGTTSDAIVQVFGVVASQVGAFGGTIKDAEDLAITFAGALGTIGMSDPMLATQEIRSILTGNIDQNSVLARSLGLTNEEITKAKTSSEGLVAFLERRLAAFTAGQKLAAQGFAGVVSNIQEVKEEAARSLGKPLLQPLLDSLTVVYERLQLVFDQILSIADGLGRIGSAAFGGLMSGIGAAPVLQGFSGRDQIAAFNNVDSTIANFAVRAQEEIDKLRPLIAQISNEVLKAIAMIGNGLGELLRGFASFKWEQLKIAAVTLTGIAQILNSTIVPLASTILSIYGRILELPLVQFLSQLEASAKVLEKTGITAALTLSYTFKVVFADAIKTALGWIKKAADFITNTITKIRDFIANALDGTGKLIQTTGERVVAGITQIVTRLILLISSAIQKLGQGLIGLAITIQAQGSPLLQGLAVPLSAVGKALNNIDAYAKKATEGVKRFGKEANAAFGQVRTAAGQAATATRNIGTTIAGFAGSKLKDLGGFLVSSVTGLIKFNLTLFAIEKGAALLLKAWSDIRGADKEISDRTQTELALKRLTTAYADLGDNASTAAKRLKEAQEAIVSNRYDALTKKLQELGPAYRKAANDMAAVQKRLGEAGRPGTKISGGTYAQVMFPGAGDATGRPGMAPPVIPEGAASPATQETAAVRAKYQKLKAEYRKYQEELVGIEEYYAREAQRSKDNEDVQILARERKEVEAAIGELRKEIEKELKDERFKTAQEVARLEQSLTEERRRIERAELDRRLARESEGLTGVQANLAQILGDYERGLFDAQTEAQRKQFEAVQARESLEKSIADYKLKLEEQTERIAKRIGDYNQKVSDYETAQAKRRNEDRIKTALRATAIEAEGYVLGPDETRKFSDAAVRADVSSTQALALLKTPGVIQSLGVAPGGNYDELMQALSKSQYGTLLRKPQGEFISALNQRMSALGQGAGSLTYKTSVQELGNQRYFQKASPDAPPKLATFGDFRQEQERFVAERRALGEQIQAATEKLSNALLELSRSETRANMIDQLSRTSLFTDVPKSVEIVKNNQDLVRDINLLGTALSSGSGKVTTLAQKLAELDTVASRSAETLATSTGVIKALPANQQKLLIQDITSIFSTALKTGKKTWNYDFEGMVKNFNLSQKELAKLGITADRFKQDFLATVSTVMSTLLEARQQVIQGAPLLDRNARLQALKNDAIEAASSLPDMLMNAKFEALTNLNSLSAGNSPLKQRLAEAQNINTARILKYSKDNGLSDAVVASQVRELNDQYTRAYRELGLFEEELKNATSRIALAKELAADIAAGYRNIFMAFAQGGDIQSAFTQMATGIQEKIVGSFMEYATRPLVDQLENTLLKALKAPSPEELAQKYRDALLQTNNTGLQNLNLTMQELPGKIATAISGAGTTANSPVATTPAGAPTTAGSPGSVNTLTTFNAEAWGAGGSNQVDWNQVSKTPLSSLQLPKSTVDFKLPPNWEKPVVDSALAYSTKLKESTDSLSKIKKATDDTPQSFSKLQKGVAGAVQALSAVAMAVSGVEQIKEGGTYNTLMGIASIFGAIGSITGMFGKGGVFGKKASGGPVSARIPYLVGEQGPELFVPNAFGSILPNNQTDALLASRGALYSGDPSSTEGESPESGYTPTQALQATRDAVGTTPTQALQATRDTVGTTPAQALQATREAIGGDTATSTPDALAAATGASRAFIASNSAINASRAALAATTALSRERQIDATLTASLKAQPAPMTVNYESRVINNVEYVTADQFQRGISDAAERGRALTLNALKNSVKARRQVGI